MKIVDLGPGPMVKIALGGDGRAAYVEQAYLDLLQPISMVPPYTLHPTPYTLHPTPYTLHPKP